MGLLPRYISYTGALFYLAIRLHSTTQFAMTAGNAALAAMPTRSQPWSTSFRSVLCS